MFMKVTMKLKKKREEEMDKLVVSDSWLDIIVLKN